MRPSNTSRRPRALTGTATTRRPSPRFATVSGYCRASAPGYWYMAGSSTMALRKWMDPSRTGRCASWTSRTSSLKDTLVDISARGRHLNLTLFGAQQFRSKVDDEVVGNAATSLYGRIGDE